MKTLHLPSDYSKLVNLGDELVVLKTKDSWLERRQCGRSVSLPLAKRSVLQTVDTNEAQSSISRYRRTCCEGFSAPATWTFLEPEKSRSKSLGDDQSKTPGGN